MSRILFFALAFVVALSAETALAHPGHSVDPTFLQGFVHPFGGVDHVLAATAVGLLAFFLGGRALWALPIAYVAIMLVGGMAGMLGFEGAVIEHGIAASLLILGLLIALATPLPLLFVVPLISLFAMFHGAAHSTEGFLNGGTAAIAYFAGFLLATSALIGAGILLAKAVSTQERLARRIAGVSVGTVGVLMFVA